MFEILPIPAFKDNYIWLLVRDGRAAVVDPGDAVPVIARLAALHLQLETVLITHHHDDHQGGVEELVARWQPRVFGPAAESITGCTDPLSGGETIDVLGQDVDVLPVGGHTRGHLAYFVPGALFCGDTLFGAGCGRLFEGTPAQMHASLARLAALPDDTLVYCAHEYTEANLRFALAVEPDNAMLRERAERVAALRAKGLSTVPSTLREEKATNPFLRCSEPAVIEAALAHAVQQGDFLRREASPLAGRAAVDTSQVAIFAAIRSWRNGF
jgi:hydroxyacylglutathione hydrolase